MQFDAICSYFSPSFWGHRRGKAFPSRCFPAGWMTWDFPVVPSHILGQAEGLGEAAKFTLAGSKLMTEKRLTLPWKLLPGRLTWNLKITYLKRKIIFQTSIIMFHVNLRGCNSKGKKPPEQKNNGWSDDDFFLLGGGGWPFFNFRECNSVTC